MTKLTTKSLQQFKTAPNGPNMIKTAYVTLRWIFPGLFKSECPYSKNDNLFIHAVGTDERITLFSCLCLLGFKMKDPQIQSGHYSIYVEPKRHQLDTIIKFVEDTFSYTDVCELIERAKLQQEDFKTRDTAVITQFLERR